MTSQSHREAALHLRHSLSEKLDSYHIKCSPLGRAIVFSIYSRAINLSDSQELEPAVLGACTAFSAWEVLRDGYVLAWLKCSHMQSMRSSEGCPDKACS